MVACVVGVGVTMPKFVPVTVNVVVDPSQAMYAPIDDVTPLTLTSFKFKTLMLMVPYTVAPAGSVTSMVKVYDRMFSKSRKVPTAKYTKPW